MIPPVDLLCAELSQIAYLDRSAIPAALASMNLSAPQFFDDSQNSRGFLASNGDRSFVVFRGTEKNYLDILTDIFFLPRPIDDTSGFEAHSGFLVGINSIWQAVAAAIGGTTAPLVFTGHSLGAALATLAFCKANRTANLITFGCPRTVNGTLAKHLNVLLCTAGRRYVHGYDIVPRVPFGPDFAHVGDAISLDDHIPDALVLAEIGMNRVYEAHRMAAYLAAMSALHPTLHERL